ncbi:4'-phosphopantetheinyl transferase [Rhodoblastus acidophilus]|uniref:4'-phosphopantetheinyl transferase family protein n=1 Tax=Rhodoblastus acidophilus TaxID=1074 RepID=UPI00222562F6|nr:4'-phosphopantetheinyl transferase superfamily protein [Rhodoblastus acidophilus]MCW2314955.1 4'-phosphopantetheinyl transferase [Rhodoblastus acidophilus]
MFTRLGLFDGRPESRRAALLDFCADALALSRDRLRLAHDPLGAPLLLIDGAPTEWRISSSSREDVWLFGLTRRGAIGVDLEIFYPIEPPAAVLHPDEKKRLAALPALDAAAAFYDIWTVKEAYIKALGLGLRREVTQIRVTPGAALVLDDQRRKVTLTAARRWRDESFGKQAICAAVILSPAP